MEKGRKHWEKTETENELRTRRWTSSLREERLKIETEAVALIKGTLGERKKQKEF